MFFLARAISLAMLTTMLLAPSTAAAVTVTVDANANRRPIDPRIYGVAYATTAQLADLNAPLHRAGGNTTSRYNWLQNAANHDFDYFFESIADGTSVAGESGDTFVQNSKAAQAQAMLTIPMVGWVAKLGPTRNILPSFSVAKYGTQCATDPFLPDAGNGLHLAGCVPITGNDPNDANVPADSTFQKAWVQHLTGKWGIAVNGGVKYYILDNEHSIWFSTHRDVHPVGPHMTEIRDKMIDYGTMIKSVDAGATVIGPEEYGWYGYLFSGYDQQWTSINGYSTIPDYTAMGGMDYMPWLLGQLKQSAIATGVKPIDVFSLHYYPQQGEFSNTDVSTATQLLRNRSTRSLWDPAYVDTSYINAVVQLIPRMRNWADGNYFPGTPIAITEYNWGAEGHINGATAQADIYGIFGREGLDIGARWTTPATGSPTYNAMKMYRNYDGNKNTFGDSSVAATVANPDNLAAFAAQRSSDGALTVMVINKDPASAPLTLAIGNFASNGSAQVFQMSAANGGAITHPANAGVVSNAINATLPAQSITLFVLPPPAGTLTLQAVQSRKVHGATGSFDLPLDTSPAISGNVSVEPRAIGTGTGHQIVFQFNGTVNSIGTVSAMNSASVALTATAAFSGNEVTVTLPNVPDNSRATVSLPVVNGVTVNARVSLGFLVGDVNNTRAVNSSDISGVKARSGQSTTTLNFQFDVNASGAVNSSDISAVKARSGLTLP